MINAGQRNAPTRFLPSSIAAALEECVDVISKQNLGRQATLKIATTAVTPEVCKAHEHGDVYSTLKLTIIVRNLVPVAPIGGRLRLID